MGLVCWFAFRCEGFANVKDSYSKFWAFFDQEFVYVYSLCVQVRFVLLIIVAMCISVLRNLDWKSWAPCMSSLVICSIVSVARLLVPNAIMVCLLFLMKSNFI